MPRLLRGRGKTPQDAGTGRSGLSSIDAGEFYLLVRAGALFAQRLDVANSSLPSLSNRAANDLDVEAAACRTASPLAGDQRSGVRVRTPASPPPEPDDDELAGAKRAPLMLPPRPSWVPESAQTPIPRDAAATARAEMITLPEVPHPSRRAAVRARPATLSPLTWATVCGVTFVLSLSVGRVLLGF